MVAGAAVSVGRGPADRYGGLETFLMRWARGGGEPPPHLPLRGPPPTSTVPSGSATGVTFVRRAAMSAARTQPGAGVNVVTSMISALSGLLTPATPPPATKMRARGGATDASIRMTEAPSWRSGNCIGDISVHVPAFGPLNTSFAASDPA